MSHIQHKPSETDTNIMNTSFGHMKMANLTLYVTEKCHILIIFQENVMKSANLGTSRNLIKIEKMIIRIF